MITVAVPTLARRDYALAALGSIARQICDTPFEVLVLDNGCDPALRTDVEKAASCTDVPVRYVPVLPIGLHNARHEAARSGRGDVLVYVDDDVIAEEGWLASIAGCFTDPTVHMVGGRCLPEYETEPPPWVEAFWIHGDDGSSSCGYLTLVDLGPDPKDVDPLSIWGANFSIRKDTLYRVGGFHPDGLPWDVRRFRGDGETAVSRAVAGLGLRAVYSPGAIVRHRVPRGRLEESYFERRAFLQGISDSFSASRAAGGALVPQPRPGLGRRVRRRVGAVRRQVLARGRSAESTFPQSAQVLSAHAAGYAHHQEMLRTDPAVHAWVMMENYWDADVPIPDNGPSGAQRP